MADKKFTFVKGELITLANGELSDYEIEGFFTVEIDFEASEQMAVWADINDLKVSDQGVVRAPRREIESFNKWLLRSGFVKRVDYRELHTGSYGETELNFYKEAYEKELRGD